MKKVLFASLFALLAVLNEAGAQTAQPVQGQPVSASRDAVIATAAADPVADSTGTAATPAKDAAGPQTAAPAALPPSPGATKAEEKKQPKR